MLHDVKKKSRCAPGWRVPVLGALVLLVAVPAVADAGPSAGVLLRRARYAVAEGRVDEAASALRAARAAEPRTRRGLEAALALADLEFTRGNAAAAESVLAAAAKDFADGDAAAQLLIARGWLAVARGDADAALRHFTLVPGRSNERHAVEIALLGAGWARLVSPRGVTEVPQELKQLASSASDPALRAAALLSLARAHSARGQHKKALRKLRKLRRLARATSFADDVELAIGLAQLDKGSPAAARRTWQRLADSAPAAEPALLAAGTELPTLSDLRLPPAAFAARLARLYARRRDPALDVVGFVAAALDRPARNDVPAALSLADAAIAARKER